MSTIKLSLVVPVEVRRKLKAVAALRGKAMSQTAIDLLIPALDSAYAEAIKCIK